MYEFLVYSRASRNVQTPVRFGFCIDSPDRTVGAQLVSSDSAVWFRTEFECEFRFFRHMPDGGQNVWMATLDDRGDGFPAYGAAHSPESAFDLLLREWLKLNDPPFLPDVVRGCHLVLGQATVSELLGAGI